MAFVIGEHYDRQFIHNELGGEVDHYLPQKDGKIVCGCFRSDENPFAPDEVLVGNGDVIEKKAKRFALQRWYVPVFIRRGAHEWEYVGDYRVSGITENLATIERKQREAGRTNVTSVLYLERKPVAAQTA